jgi:hypothetical protein
MKRTRLTIVVYERTRVVVRSRPGQRLTASDARAPDASLVPSFPPAPPARRRLPKEDSSMKGFLRSLLVDIALACVASSVLLSMIAARSPRLAARERAEADAVARTREALRGELTFAREGASADEVRQSVESVRTFVGRRAGVGLDDAVADRLASLERRTLSGELRRLPVPEVSAVLADILCERVRDLTDDEIARAADEFGNVIPVGRLEELGSTNASRYAVAKRLRGATGQLAAKRAVYPGNKVMLRFDGSGTMTSDQFVEQMTEIRSRLRSPVAFALVSAQARGVVESYLDERLAPIEVALPEDWGAVQSVGLTPIQSIVTAYAAASDDPLTDSAADLARVQEMTVEQYLPSAAKSLAGEHRPAFGRYGDRFSTPLELVFDAKTLGRLLDRLEVEAAR